MHIAWIDVVGLSSQTVSRRIEVVDSKVQSFAEEGTIQTNGKLLTLDERKILIATTL